jgi:hypothetical protein
VKCKRHETAYFNNRISLNQLSSCNAISILLSFNQCIEELFADGHIAHNGVVPAGFEQQHDDRTSHLLWTFGFLRLRVDFPQAAPQTNTLISAQRFKEKKIDKMKC